MLGIVDDIFAESKSLAPMQMYKLPGGTEPLTTFYMDPYVPPTASRPFVRKQFSLKQFAD